MAASAGNKRRDLRLLGNLTEAANASINRLVQAGESTRAALKRPTIRATAGGALVTAAALKIGIMPTAVGVAAGYIGYRLFREQQRQQAEELR